MKKILFILCLILINVPVLATNWHEYEENFFVDISSIRQMQEDFYTVWYQQLNNNSSIFKKYEKQYNKKVSRIVRRVSVNCVSDTIEESAFLVYDNNSNVIYRKDFKDKEKKEIYAAPDTEEEKLLNYVCSFDLTNNAKYNKSGSKKSLKEANKNNSINFEPFMKKLQKKIKNNWYPPKGSSNKIVIVFFSITKDGNLDGDIKIIKSSADREADNAAIKAIKNSLPFEPLPENFEDDKVDIQFTFDYKIL